MKKLLKYLFITLIILSFVFPLFYSRIIFNLIIPKEQNVFGLKIIDCLHRGEINEFVLNLDNNTRKTEPIENLNKLVNFAKINEIKDYELIGYHIDYQGDITRSELTYQTKFNDEWAFINMTLIKNEGKEKVLSINIQPTKEPLEIINAFKFRGKSSINYLFFTVYILIALFNLLVIILCIKSKIKKKWLWLLITLIGLCNFSINWTTGGWGFTPIAFNLPSASFIRNGIYAPWILSFDIPVGSILFLFKRRALIRSYIDSENNEIHKEEIIESR